MPDLSIVLGTFNRLQMLMDCVGSIRKAVGKLSYEIVITDGGSTDGTLKWLALQSDIKTIRHGELRGPVAAYNDAFHAALGEFVAYINDDLELKRDILEEAVILLRTNPDIGIISLPYRNPSGAVVRMPETSPNHEDRYPMASFGVLRKDTGDKAGWFPACMYHYHGDSALCLAVQEMGLRIEPLPCSGAACEHKRANNAVRGSGWIVPFAKERSLHDGFLLQAMWGGWKPGEHHAELDKKFLDEMYEYYGYAKDTIIIWQGARDAETLQNDYFGYNVVRRHGWNMVMALPEWSLKMGNIYRWIPPKLAITLRDFAKLDTFVETGTYKGWSSVWANANFKKVYTIEGWKEYYDRTSAIHQDKPNINFIFGDSRKQLPEILKMLDKPALLWLDAHYLGDSVKSGGTSGECPIMDELEAVNRCGIRHYIMIDDYHLFMGQLNQGSDKKQWPTAEQVFAKIREGFPDYYITQMEDVIMAVPPEAKAAVLGQKEAELIIVATSNLYVKVLPAFSYFFNKNWGDKVPVKVLRYDVRPPGLPGNFSNNSIGYQADYSWSGGIRAWVDIYAPEQFVFMLDDYLLTARVDLARFELAWELMLEDPRIVKIDLSGDVAKRPHMELIVNKLPDDKDNFIIADPDSLYQTSIQAAIWRRDFMLTYLNESESAWEFEKHGSARVIADRQAGKFTGLILGTETPVIQYVNAVGGEGRNPGQLDPKRVPGKMIKEMRRAGVLWG